MVKMNFIEKLMLIIALAITVLASAGCAGNYQLGDISKRYCQEENKEARIALKAILTAQGIEITPDYCLVRAVVVGG